MCCCDGVLELVGAQFDGIVEHLDVCISLLLNIVDVVLVFLHVLLVLDVTFELLLLEEGLPLWDVLDSLRGVARCCEEQGVLVDGVRVDSCW